MHRFDLLLFLAGAGVASSCHLSDASPEPWADAAVVAAPEALPDAAPDASSPDHDNTNLANDAESLEGEFTLTIEGGPCLGDCPTFELSLTSSGEVQFVGGHCAGRPGSFAIEVGQDVVKAVAQGIAKADFATLRERYVEEADGCAGPVQTDGAGYTMTLESAGNSKTVTRYSGCVARDIPRQQQLQELLLDSVGASAWIEPPFNCGYATQVREEIAPSYRLSRGDEEIGYLFLTTRDPYWRQASWQLRSSCEGATTSSGPVITDATRFILVSSDERSLSAPVLGELGSIVLERPPGGAIVRARALTEGEDIALALTPAACPARGERMDVR